MNSIASSKPTHSIKQKVIEHNRKWLTIKADKLKKLYRKTIMSFQEKLYALVSPTISEASEVLTTWHEDVFFEKLYQVGLNIEKCCHKLYEINLLHCDDEINSTCSDDENDSSDGLFHDSSSVSFFDVTHCAITNLSPSVPFNHLPQIGNENFDHGDLVTMNHYPASELQHSSEHFAIETTSVACQFDTVTDTDTKSSQTEEVFSNTKCNTSTTACQTDDFSTTMITNAVQTDTSYAYLSTIVESKCSQTEDNLLTKVCRSQLSSCDLPTQVEEPSAHLDITESHPTKSDVDMSAVGPIENGVVMHENEVDLLLLHNIEIGQRTCVMVSHVISPSLFSIQPKGCKDQLIELQQHIKVLYSGKKGKDLRFSELPEVGTVCVAFLNCDQAWYRAKVTKRLSPFKVEVMFIDYGDYSAVEINNIRKIMDTCLANVPQFSIQCSLCGVEPTCNKGVTEWSQSALNWFRQQILNKFYDVLFVNNYNKQDKSTHTAHLLSSSDLQNENISSSNKPASVANAMVSYRFANFSKNMPENTEEEEVPKPHTRSTPTTRKTVHSRRRPPTRPATSGRVDASRFNSFDHQPNSSPTRPAASDRVDASRFNSFDHQPNSSQPSSSPVTPFQVPFGNTQSETASLLMDELSLDGYGYDDVDSQSLHLEHPTSSTVWDPMRDDFTSDRNKYDINVDDPCVAVENIDPQKSEVCKYFAKGDCWKGKHCDRLHITNPDVLYKVEVLSGHMLQHIELECDEMIIVKVTTAPRNDDFYVHIIRRGQNVPGSECKSSITNLEELSKDLKAYYAKVGTKRSIEKQVCIGEVYALFHQQLYHRVTVIDISRPTRIQVHLVDYGYSITISPSRLLQLTDAFMHMPVQAVLCTFDKSTSAVTPDKDHCYFANVGEAMESVDSPIPLTLLSKF